MNEHSGGQNPVAALCATRELGLIVARAYEAYDKRELAKVLLVEYHCLTSKHCVLLRCWQSPHGVLFYKPRYKLSPERTESSSVESARRRRTSDGYRRWVDSAGVLDDLRGLPDTTGFALDCDHVADSRPASKIIADADKATPGRPTRRSF